MPMKSSGVLVTLITVLSLVLSSGTAAYAADPIWTVADARQALNGTGPGGLHPQQNAGNTSLRTTVERTISSAIAARVNTGRLGAAASIHVVDVASGETIYQRKPKIARTVASNTKLLTAVATLRSYAPKHRFETTIARRADKATVYFVSGGDPRLTNGKLRKLAQQTAQDLKTNKASTTKIRVRLDDSLFSGRKKHKSWRQGGYNLATIQPVRATARPSVRVKDSAGSAAAVFTTYLNRELGKSGSARYSGRAKAPKRADSVATVRSQTVKKLVRRVLLNSDNQVAEVLHRHVALAQGRKPTFAGGARASLKILRKLGIDTTGATMIDGSGLSPRNTMPPRFLTSLLVLAADPSHKELRSILYQGSALPMSGTSGTLHSAYGRFTSTDSRCGAGHIVAKTGNLDYEIALSGYAVAADGRLKAFSVLVNSVRGTAKITARRTMDEIAASISAACARR